MIAAIHRHIALWQRRRSLGWLLRRADDHLLHDIGLTRDDVRILLDGTGGSATDLPATATLHRLCPALTD